MRNSVVPFTADGCKMGAPMPERREPLITIHA
jgi:hypothetical protein